MQSRSRFRPSGSGHAVQRGKAQDGDRPTKRGKIRTVDFCDTGGAPERGEEGTAPKPRGVRQAFQPELLHMGHADVSTTMNIYTHDKGSKTLLRKTLDKVVGE